MAQIHRRTHQILAQLTDGTEVSQKNRKRLEARAATYARQIEGLKANMIGRNKPRPSNGQLRRKGEALRDLLALEGLTRGFRA